MQVKKEKESESIEKIEKQIIQKWWLYYQGKFNSSAFKKKHSCPTTQLRKILTDNTTILEHQNNKQKLQILEAYILETCNQHSIELIFEPVLMNLNVFSYWH